MKQFIHQLVDTVDTRVNILSMVVRVYHSTWKSRIKEPNRNRRPQVVKAVVESLGSRLARPSGGMRPGNQAAKAPIASNETDWSAK